MTHRTYISSSEVFAANQFGNVPVMPFSLRNNNRKLVSFPNDVGIGPLMLDPRIALEGNGEP